MKRANTAWVRLLDAVKARIRTKHYSLRTEQAYLHCIKRFIYFHDKRHPLEMGAAEVERFLSSLAVNDHVSSSTQNQAPVALLFHYREVLSIERPWLDRLTRSKQQEEIPVVLTQSVRWIGSIQPPLRFQSHAVPTQRLSP